MEKNEDLITLKFEEKKQKLKILCSLGVIEV
jgi:hypothetical protein